MSQKLVECVRAFAPCRGLAGCRLDASTSAKDLVHRPDSDVGGAFLALHTHTALEAHNEWFASLPIRLLVLVLVLVCRIGC